MFSFKLLVATLALSSVDGRINKPDHRDLESTPSAGFTAAWSDDPVVAGDCINTNTDSVWGEGSEYVGYCGEFTGDNPAEVFLAQTAPLGWMKIPQGKEILATLSAEINLFTLNTATSKTTGKKGEETSTIGATKTVAGVDVVLVAISATTDERKICAPGPVTMASRMVELRNQITANITYEDCYGDVEDQTCVTKIADHEIVSSIGLAMGTTAAHSFQWVCADMPADTYKIAAEFTISAEAQDLCEQINADCADIADLAIARVILQKRILTALTVRAVKGALDGEWE